MKRWKIFYDDGNTFSSDDGEWKDAPSDGVIYVVVWSEGRKDIYSGKDHYFFDDGLIASTDDVGPLLRKLGIVKYGRWTTHRRFEELSRRVREEP